MFYSPRVDPTGARRASPEQNRHGSTQLRRAAFHARPASDDARAPHEARGAPARQPMSARSAQQPVDGSRAPQEIGVWSDSWALSMLSPTKRDYKRESDPELQGAVAFKAAACWESSLCEAKQEEDSRMLTSCPLYPEVDCVSPHLRLKEVYTPELRNQWHMKAVEDWRASLQKGKRDEDARVRRLRACSPPPWFEQEGMTCSVSSSSLYSTSAGSTRGASSRSSKARSQPPSSPSQEQRLARVEETVQEAGGLDPGDPAAVMEPRCGETLATAIRGTRCHSSTGELRQRLARAEKTLANLRGHAGDSGVDFRANEGVSPNLSRGSGSDTRISATDKLRRRLARIETYGGDLRARSPTSPPHAAEASDSGFLEAFETFVGWRR